MMITYTEKTAAVSWKRRAMMLIGRPARPSENLLSSGSFRPLRRRKIADAIAIVYDNNIVMRIRDMIALNPVAVARLTSVTAPASMTVHLTALSG